MTVSRSIAFSVLTLLGVASNATSQGTPAAASAPYRDPRLPIDARVRDLLGRMTLEQKFWQLFMIPGDLTNPANDYSNGIFGLQMGMPRADSGLARDTTPGQFARAQTDFINSAQRYFVEKTTLGIPIIPFEEAVHGFVRPGGTMFPQAIALAATWDTSLMRRVSTAIARETRSRGVRQVLSPVINIADDVRWGRVEETYGEDPVLTSTMARVFVSSFERAGVIATPKHFVANVGEGGRDSYPIDIDQRLLEESYFPPFRTAITEGGARSIMSSYNSVDGSPASQNRALLTTTLAQWGFSGFVISDAAAVGGATVLHHTEASTATATADALNAGLDVIFQSSFDQNRPYLDAFRRGLIPDSVIDAAVTRVLRAKFQLGLFEHPYANPDSAAYWNGSAAHRALALEAARSSIVLLRNEHGVLPLARTARSVAVIGTDAMEARLGGYSGPGNAKVSILDGVREKMGTRGTVSYAPGPGRISTDYVPVPESQLSSSANGQTSAGLHGEYFDNTTLAGAPRLVRTDRQVNFGWTLNSPGRGIPFDWYSVRWTGTLAVPAGGVHHLGVEGNDGYRLYVDDSLIVDDWRNESYGTRLADVSFASGSTHSLRLEFFASTGVNRVKLVWDAGVPNVWQAQIDSAVRIARRSDVAVVVAGIEEGEFRDRAKLGLPGHQEQLISAVAATGKPTVVVLVGGSAITMSNWLDHVDGVLDAWYDGEQGGRAVADVLFGDYDPAGRLPITFPMSEGQLPLHYNHKPTGRGDDYLDLTGQPLFPFGFGLSYTRFEYSNLTITPDTTSADNGATVHCRVKNIGAVAGEEVVQLYVHQLLASVARPIMQLEGFSRIHLEPGQQADVTFHLSRPELRMLDRDMHWVVEPGVFRVLVGASSKDIRLRGDLTIH